MAKKKEFKLDNPALKFLDTDDTHNTQYTQSTDNTPGAHCTDNTDSTHNTPTTHYRGERKKKRLNLTIYPSLLEDMQKIATMKQSSVNDLINEVLIEYAEQQAETIQKYNDIFN